MNYIDNLINNNASLVDVFLWSLKQFPYRHALWVDNQFYTYDEVYHHSLKISSYICHDSSEVCMILSRRSLTQYCAILGSLLSGKAYAPVNYGALPVDVIKTIRVIQSSLLVIDSVNTHQVRSILQMNTKPLTLFIVEDKIIPQWLLQMPQYQIIQSSQAYAVSRYRSVNAYLLFTSGTTGNPNGIMVRHQNILHYLARIVDRCEPDEFDRFTQLADISFDFSVHDMFVPWSVGGCVYSMNHYHLLHLRDFMQHHHLTFWSSVPSTISFLKQQNRLQRDGLSSLRYSVFCGETLYQLMARYWHSVSPHAVIDNLYGPTEAAVACMGYRWQSIQQSQHDTVPIGLPFPQQAYCLLDQSGGDTSELLLSGPQVVAGYWQNALLTQQRFIKLPNVNGTWYRTRDLVCWDDEVGFIYHGRLDDQIKIRGQAITRLAIESRLKQLLCVDSIAVLIIPFRSYDVSFSVIAFVCDCRMTVSQMMALARAHLPDIMIPKEVILLETLPVNARGKIDYAKLLSLYQHEECHL